MRQSLQNKLRVLRAERMTGIGGSDAAAVIGKSPWKKPTDVWMEKLSLVPESATTKQMERGIRLESEIAAIYCEETGNEVDCGADEAPLFFRRDSAPFMIAHPDGVIWQASKVNDERGLLEIKAPSLKVFREIVRNGVPAHYLIQLQHNMHVCGLKWSHFVAFSAELWESVITEVAYDAEFCAMLEQKEREFWNCVEKNEQPPDIVTPINIELPPVGGNVRILQVEAADGDLREEWRTAIARYREAADMSEAAELMREEAKQNIIELLGEATVAEGFGMRIHYTEQAGRKTFDAKALQKVYPELDLNQFYKEGKPFRAFKTYTLKGE